MCINVEPGTGLNSASKSYADCQVGEHFFFGSYPQGKNGEVAPIEWRVLARESDRMLVIAERALDCKQYNEEFVDINWSQCTLRSWLNGEFMEKAFSAEERGSLLEVTLRNHNSPKDWDNVPGCPDTRDKVFLLSIDEAEHYFRGFSDRCCKPTAYAVEQGAWLSKEDAYAGNSWWWLRSSCGYVGLEAFVFDDGSIRGNHVDSGCVAVRPVAFMAL